MEMHNATLGHQWLPSTQVETSLVTEQLKRREQLNVHPPRPSTSQIQVTVNTSPGGELPAPGTRSILSREPLQEVGCHAAEAIRCDKR